MRKLLLGFILGVIVGVGAFYYYNEQLGSSPDAAQTRQTVANSATKVKEAIQEKLSSINTDEIKRELERTGTVVREKAGKAGTAIADATANARVTGSVKARLINEMGTAALNINVDTTDGLVTLSGTAASHEEVARAVKTALETEGVLKVISTVQVKPAK
jgi:osmotically-inducible protein OsmY